MNQTGKKSREIVLYSDVDGTLLGPSGELGSKTIRAIEDFVAHGYGFTLATGRSLRAVRRILRFIPVNTPLVLCNGAYVFDPSTGCSRWSALSRFTVNEVFPMLQSMTGVRMYIERSDDTLWVTDASILREPYVKQEDLKPQILKDLDELFCEGDVLKIGIKLTEANHLTMAQLQEFIAYLTRELDSEVSWCYSSHDYLEIMSSDTSKWSGIQQSQALRGCRDKTIITVGDHHNDVEMIMRADIGVAMENAVAAVKEVSSLQIGHVDKESISELLRNIHMGASDMRTPHMNLSSRVKQ